ncbi:carbohydrate ABC transporter permease [Fimbriimonas ginsengisoli]|uniref:Sugar ABC transporter, permease protein n=1 Tax=Fimbriimonas ginsengisoli Gsoil 348 TaxID=661478 RepID=A0A068NPA8_FIMGI|nr:carbohydrate ABC transporter permease [Fimbriimonas ginsengisoli]AIE84545.1 sugar ABC transporter, permease protein [Fimbriimonas ginsengisoli Gsoil 348]
MLLGTLIAWLPARLGLGAVSGWLIGVPMAIGAVVVLQGVLALGELPIVVPSSIQRAAGLAMVLLGAWLWRLGEQAPIWHVVGGALGAFGLILAAAGAGRKAASYWTLGLLAAVLFAPFVWMVLVSLHPPKSPIPELKDILPMTAVKVSDSAGGTTPKLDLHWENYDTVLNSPTLPVRRFFLNTAFVTFTVVLAQLLFTSLAAYGLSRVRFKGREIVFALFLGSMMFAGPVTQIPVYLMLRSFGWLDTYWALIVPGVSSSFSVFLLRQFFLQIPFELDEAARIDGASDLVIYWRVIMPLSRAALATAAAFTFFGVWTDFFGPLIYTNSTELRTLEVGLSIFKNSYGGSNWPLQMAAALIVLTPLLIVFLFVQRYFTKGIMLGSLK